MHKNLSNQAKTLASDTEIVWRRNSFPEIGNYSKQVFHFFQELNRIARNRPTSGPSSKKSKLNMLQYAQHVTHVKSLLNNGKSLRWNSL